MMDALPLILALLTVDEIQEYRHLPPLEVCQDFYHESAVFYEWLDKLPDNTPLRETTKAECKQLRQFWFMMKDAQSASSYQPDENGSNRYVPHWEYRRHCREWCRRVLGDEAWMRQQWPPAVPWWRLPHPRVGAVDIPRRRMTYLSSAGKIFDWGIGVLTLKEAWRTDLPPQFVS